MQTEKCGVKIYPTLVLQGVIIIRGTITRVHTSTRRTELHNYSTKVRVHNRKD